MKKIYCDDCKYSYVDELFIEWRCRKNRIIREDNETTDIYPNTGTCDDFEEEEYY